MPAYNLTINGVAPTANVSSVVASGTTTFTATNTGANLNVADIATALAAGNVIVTNGSTIAEDGTIIWTGGGAGDLSYLGTSVHSLTIVPDVSSLFDNITLNNVKMTFADNVDLAIESTVNGYVYLLSDTQINEAASVTLNAGSNDVQLASSSTASMASGDIHITAGAFQNLTTGYDLQSDHGDVKIDGDVLLPGSMAIRTPLGTLTINGAIDSFTGKDLTTYGATVALNGAIGDTSPLGTLSFAGGSTTFSSTIDATTVNVGDGVADSTEATVSSSGMITANVDVKPDGVLAPGGTATPGAMNIAGNLTFDGGTYALDLGAAPDKIKVSGNLTINSGNLGDDTSTGALTGAGTFTIIDVSGSSAGAFNNAPLNQALIVGFDAISVTAYTPDVAISQVPSTVGGIATGNEVDGTTYKMRLTGPGELVVFKDQFGAINMVAHNTTLASKITVTTIANASDDLVVLGPVLIAGDLGSFSAPNAMLEGNFTVRTLPGTSGTIKALSVFEAFAPIVTPGALNSITIGRDAFFGVSALSIGKVKVAGLLIGTSVWNVVQGISSITAGNITGLLVNAKYIGTLSAIGERARHLAGDMLGVTLTLSGNDSSKKAYGLKSLTAKGNVQNSTFNVQGGNAGTITVGRFLNSNLYVGYTPNGAFNTGGDFGGTHFKIERFSTTAITLNDSSSPFNYAFAGSQIAADTLGTVRLSGVDTTNANVAFGIKFRTLATSVQARSADSVAISPNKNLTPILFGGPALAIDFFYLKL